MSDKKHNEEIEQETQHPKQKAAVQGGIQPVGDTSGKETPEQETQHIQQKEAEAKGTTPGYDHSRE